MVRTVIALDPKDKAWLDRKARKERVAMTEIVRQAVQQMRARDEISYAELLEHVRGKWKGGDGLEYQRRIRSEWR
jgi:hypothetical protein